MKKVIDEIPSAMAAMATRVSVIEGSLLSVDKTLALILVKLEERSSLEKTPETPLGGSQIRKISQDSGGGSNENTEGPGEGSGAIRAVRRIACFVKPSLMQLRSTFSVGSFMRPMATFRSSPSPTAADSGQHLVGSVKGGHSQLFHTDSSWPKGNRKSRPLTPEQVNDYRTKRKCFKCSQPYTPLHKCASKYLSVIIGAEEEYEGELNDEG
ncbi:hypothetical protein C2S52_012314 [Perilla frutescens var. hirtella]|nr:hypothetical protein C2S52_012314 [Perilla frutescens var. hirtella]